MDSKTSEVIERVDATISAPASSFSLAIAAMREELRGEIRASLEDYKRYTKMLNDELRDDIRKLAESVAAMSVKLDSLQR